MSRESKKMRRIAVNRGTFEFHEVSRPVPRMDETLVRVAAVSLDRCYVEQALAAGGRVSEWDFSGTVELPAADGSGPIAGTRVAGIAKGGAWAELVSVPSDALAEISDKITFAQACTLPIAGLTALHGLDGHGLLGGQEVLVTSATCSVGLLAVQLAHASSANVTAAIDFPDHEALVEEYGADRVLTGDSVASAKSGPFDLILDVGGMLATATALGMLRTDGTYVLLRARAREREKIGGQVVQLNETLRLRRLSSIFEIRRFSFSAGLRRLFWLARMHVIQPHIELEDDWSAVAAVGRTLENDQHVGKAVLHVKS